MNFFLSRERKKFVFGIRFFFGSWGGYVVWFLGIMVELCYLWVGIEVVFWKVYVWCFCLVVL